MTTFLGNSLTWWTGILGGVFFLLLIITTIVKQFNWKWFMRWQVVVTPLHHWFGWLAFGLLALHSLLAVLSSNFHVFF